VSGRITLRQRGGETLAKKYENETEWERINNSRHPNEPSMGEALIGTVVILVLVFGIALAVAS